MTTVDDIVRDIHSARAAMDRNRGRLTRSIALASASPSGGAWVDRLSAALRDLDTDPQVALLANLAAILSGDDVEASSDAEVVSDPMVAEINSAVRDAAATGRDPAPIEPASTAPVDKMAHGRRYHFTPAQQDAIRADRADGASWADLTAKWGPSRATLQAIVAGTWRAKTMQPTETAPATAADDDADVKIEKIYEVGEWAIDLQTRGDRFESFAFWHHELNGGRKEWLYIEDHEMVPDSVREFAVDYYEERWEEESAA